MGETIFVGGDFDCCLLNGVVKMVWNAYLQQWHFLVMHACSNQELKFTINDDPMVVLIEILVTDLDGRLVNYLQTLWQ